MELILLTLETEDIGRRTVWLGWHAVKKISTAPKGWLISVRNLELSARAKASLIGFTIILDSKTKVWSSEPLHLLDGG